MASVAGTGTPSRRLDRVETLVKTFTGISLIVGIAVGIWGPGGLLRADKKMKLDSLNPIKELVAEDYTVKRAIAALEWTQLEQEVCASLASQRTGHDTYFSEAAPVKRLSEITEHYERMGSMVALGYVQFDRLFEVISFPDDFWRRLTRVRGVLAQHWRSPLFSERALPDLWGNFYNLCERFQHKRARFGSPTIDCRVETKDAAPCLYALPARPLPPPASWSQKIFW